MSMSHPTCLGNHQVLAAGKETAKLCLNNADSIFQWHRCFEKSHQSHPYHHNVCVYVYVYVCVCGLMYLYTCEILPVVLAMMLWFMCLSNV